MPVTSPISANTTIKQNKLKPIVVPNMDRLIKTEENSYDTYPFESRLQINYPV